MVIYDSKGKIIKSALGPRNEKKAKELIDEYNALRVGDSLYTSNHLGRYLDFYFREHGLSYGQDFMCPPYREGEIVKLTDKKVVSSKQIKSTFELEGKDKRYNPFFKGTYKPNSFYWAGYWIDKSTPWIVFHTTDEAQIIIDDAFATEEEAKNLSEQLDHLYVEVENLDDVFPDEAERKYYENGKHALSYNIGSSRQIKSSRRIQSGYTKLSQWEFEEALQRGFSNYICEVSRKDAFYGPEDGLFHKAWLEGWNLAKENNEEQDWMDSSRWEVFKKEHPEKVQEVIQKYSSDIIRSSRRNNMIKSNWFRYTVEINTNDGNVYQEEYEGANRSEIRKDIENDFPNMKNFTILDSEDLSGCYSSRQIKSVYTRPDSERYDKYGYFNPYTPTVDELLKTDEIKKVLSKELSKAYEPDPMDDYAGYDSTNERIGAVIEKVAKQFNVDTDYVDELAGKIQKEEYARTMTEAEWVYEHCNDKDKFWAWQNGENISLEELGIDKEQMDKEVGEIVHKYVNSSRNIKSSRKPIKSSYEEAFTVYPWDPNQVTGTSDADLGLSYVVEAYGDEFVNVDEDTLNDIKDTLVQYFDDEAYVRDWNINYPNDQIEDAFDIVDPETMEVDDLAQYFDYEAYGRDIRLNNRMVWDSEEECWVSASDINDKDLDDSKYIWIGSSKQQIRSERASQTVDKHLAEDLELYAENTAEVYERFITPVVKNLRRKVKKGIYDEDKALIAWQNVIDEAAKMYDKEQGSGKGSLIMFNKATRNEAAKGLMERMSDDVFQEE